ncbi:rod shape-determining protein MreD [Fusobacterium animalis ATCC 51191]|uniref:Rod shape-determining protein MreD n=1 Tax=Fusobacterium animalis ATCC 51191 TaxID=997347 RepID=F9EL07_9FUSO|nr:rod shape-determining protein MreD [Fusobacterium animalis ATCC 51191]
MIIKNYNIYESLLLIEKYFIIQYNLEKLWLTRKYKKFIIIKL